MRGRVRMGGGGDQRLTGRGRPSGRRRVGRPVVSLVAVLATVAAGLAGGPVRPAAADGCAATPIVCENSLPGTPMTDWDIDGAGDPTIQGYAADISVDVGQRIDFKIKTPASGYTIDIYRLGWYGGAGARHITAVTPSLPLQQQPDLCVTDPQTQMYDCGNWHVSASWNVPPAAVSGVYLARLKRTDDATRDDPGIASHITFVVRDDSGSSKIFFKTSDATWHAYNTYGGGDFYEALDNGRAYKVSYNRPFGTRGDSAGRDFLFSNEYPMLRFLERNGYDVNYTTDIDTDRRGTLIRNHRVFLSVGHDEYWSAAERSNVEDARDAGVNLAFFSGNEVYWRTRLGPSEAGTATPNRTVICYKETWGNAKIDTTSPQWTGTWRDPRFTPSAVGGGNPENALTGTAYMANTDDLTLQVPEQQGKLRLWRNTSVATLATGQTASLAPHTIGYESDEDLDNGFRPPGLIRLSTTTGPTPEYLRDFGNTVTAGTTTHHLTLYRAASGALVFGAGTVQWSWGLDSVHDGTVSPADPRMQQATINLFADMGTQPATLMAGLVAATASTDTQGPAVTITAPASNSAVTNGALVALRGTATDTGGGRAAGVEVSTDGGATWHPANGVSPWDYSFISSGAGNQQIRVRAVDDSANIGAATLLPLRLNGPSTILGTRGPANPSVGDNSAVELGVKFTPGDDGYVTGVRFYKGNLNTGTHTGSLWTAAGTRLGTGTFTGESSAGWQTLTFASPIPVTGGNTYVASYTAPNGHYAADALAFSAADIDSAPLVAPRSTQVSPNGLFAYGSGFPTRSYNDANYFVDVTFIDSEVGAPTSLAVNPPSGARTVGVGVHPSVVFSKSLNPASIQFTLRSQAGTAIAGTISYDDATHTVTLTPAAALAVSTGYTATVMASDAQGHPADASTGWSFTTDAYTTINTMFGANATPQVAADGDPNGVELGVKFVPAGDGKIIGVRFYQGPGNTGTHTGSLWSASGTLLARATFAGENGSGWQSVRFDTPVEVNADTTYVASYHAPNGHYSSTSNFFSTLWTNGPLSAPPTAANGVYRYGAEAFPQFSYNATNYWVDPLYVPDVAPDPDPSPSPSPSGPLGPPVGLFADAATPANPNWDDPSSIEVGAKFTATSPGVVTGARFYKGPSNNGIHTASLWTSGGELLATASFTSETPSGWQTVSFARGVPVAAGTTYVVSYWTSVGRYAVDFEAFADHGVDRPPLHLPAGGSGYHYGGGFPDSPTSHNFWVDVVFRPNL